MVAGLMLSLSTIQYSFAQYNETGSNMTRSFMNCYNGNINFFLLQMIFAPPEIKFNMTDLMSPEVKQYFSDACNFYHDKSGVWLTGTDDDLDRKIISQYGNEFMQKVKTPESIKERAVSYMKLNNKTN